MKQFKTVPEEVDENLIDLVIEIDGEEITLQPPRSKAGLMWITAQSKSRDEADRAAATVDFFYGMLAPQSRQKVMDRLYDMTDDFGLEQVIDIIEYAVEEWSDRPTKPPSASSRSRRTSGSGSTAKRPSGE